MDHPMCFNCHIEARLPADSLCPHCRQKAEDDELRAECTRLAERVAELEAGIAGLRCQKPGWIYSMGMQFDCIRLGRPDKQRCQVCKLKAKLAPPAESG